MTERKPSPLSSTDKSANSSNAPPSQTLATKEEIIFQITGLLKEAEEAQAKAVDAHKQAEATEDLEEKNLALKEAVKQDKRAKTAI
jgi:hypothetical protein